MKRTWFAALFPSLYTFGIVGDTDAQANVVPVDQAATPGQVATETTQADTPSVSITVPAEHESIVTRFVDMLKNAEQDIVDNLHAGVAYIENLWKSKVEGDTEQ